MRSVGFILAATAGRWSDRARAEVEAFIRGNGARIVDGVKDAFAGDTWEGFRYCVTKI